MNSLSKFSGPDLDTSVEFTHRNVWQREENAVGSRLLIGARDREIPLILDLCRPMRGPFGLLYVLIGSRLGHGAGRYQSPEPVNFDDLELFLYTFQEFFEQDGRHHLWIRSLSDEGQFVFDNHNIVYAYGDLDQHESKLSSAGFVQSPVETPTPHAHNYHPQFDASEDELFDYWRWNKFPLKPEDDP